ncbi:MAG: GTP-binding protein [Candidatus Heimdallarchaeota archaeon]|nr:MAG: GTP-binding protein [Candidatus Heimdallarchaeota archaeon]
MKVCLLGDGAVGKTALRERYLGKQFSSGYVMTIGADFAVKKTRISTEEGEKDVKFQIWDLAGQPRFNSVRELYYKGSHGGLLVFDITRRDSFTNLDSWVEELYKNSGRGPMPVAVLGNKVDLRDQAEDYVTEAEALEFTDNLQTRIQINCEIPYLETSAKTGVNVDQSFTRLAQSIREFLVQSK